GKVSKVVRKGKRVIRVSGEQLSAFNSRLLLNARTSLGNLGIRVRFTKFRTGQRIKEITLPVSRSFNKQVRNIKRFVKKEGVITKSLKASLSRLSNGLKAFNIHLKFAKFRIGQKLKVAKAIIKKQNFIKVFIKERKNFFTITNSEIRSLSFNL
ncbi:unnamed protein product, partial [marine sediment metagenome]